MKKLFLALVIALSSMTFAHAEVSKFGVDHEAERLKWEQYDKEHGIVNRMDRQAMAASNAAKEAKKQRDEIVNLVIFVGIFLYVVAAGLSCYRMVRRPMMNWYRNTDFIISGETPFQIMLRQMSGRLGFEFAIFGVAAFVGSLGGWLYIVLKRRAAVA